MRRDAIRRIHRATGLFPLAAYLLFHAWEHWPVRESRDALFARLTHTGHAALEVVCVLLPLSVHAALGVWLARAGADARYPSPAFRRLQAVTGGVTAAFLCLHLTTAWLPRLGETGGIGSAYMGMCDASGTPIGLALHVVGVGAVCTHLGQGIGCALTGALDTRLARVSGIAVGILLWLVLLNELAVYATSAPLL